MVNIFQSKISFIENIQKKLLNYCKIFIKENIYKLNNKKLEKKDKIF